MENMVHALFLNKVSLDFNTLSPPMFNHSIPFQEEGCIMCLQVCCNSIDVMIITSEMSNTQIRFQFWEQEKVRESQICGVWGIRQQFDWQPQPPQPVLCELVNCPAE
jgi:hypothetical protein